ncbi:MAG: DUF6876 family protein [Saprospiraceae bacterium]
MAKGQLPKEQLLVALKQFTGTTQWYKHPLFSKFVYTDGVRFLAINAGAYWLLEFILSNQTLPKIKAEGFQVWKIKVADSKAIIDVEEGNDKVIKSFKVSYTDFPLENFTLWFIDGALLLPSEY